MAVLERYGDGGRDLVMLDESRQQISVGKSSERDLVLEGDPTVSRLHARFEAIGSRWCIEDMGSRNGTSINGEKIFAPRVLHDRDEILLGRTLLVFRDLNARDAHGETTEPLGRLPRLSPREKAVLVELCRPILSASAFRPPATAKQIADALYIGEPAVRQHLGHLYDKFGLYPEGTEPRRVRLANEALQRGAVTMADLKDPPDLS